MSEGVESRAWIRRHEGVAAAADTRLSCRCAAASVVLMSALILASPALSGEPYRFDATGYLGDAALMPDWADTMRREAVQAPALDACLDDESACPRHYRGLRHLLQKAAAQPPRRQVSLISHYVNRRRYQDDTTSRIESP